MVLEAAFSDNTWKTYSIGVKNFIQFCRQQDFQQLERAEDIETVVCLWAAGLSSAGIRYATACNYISAVKAWLLALTCSRVDLRGSDLIRKVKDGLRRILGDKAMPKAPLTTTHLRRIELEMQGDSLIQIRDWTILVVGFFGLLRRSELVELQWTDIEEKSVDVWTLNIRCSKTDPGGSGHRVPLVARKDGLCPLKALRELRRVSLGMRLQPVFLRATSTRVERRTDCPLMHWQRKSSSG